MAYYVSVEDRLFLDLRFQHLAREVGEASALLALVQAWRVGRDYYLESVRANRDHLGVPRSLFIKLLHSEKILACDMARTSDCGEFVLLSGIERACDALRAKILSGRAGGLKKSKNHKPRNQRGKALATLERSHSVATATPQRSCSVALDPYPYPVPKERNRDHAANGPNGPDSQHEFEGVLTDANRGLLARVKPQAMRQWMLTYPTWFIKQESDRAAAWVAANPAKAPKSNFAKFMNGWLDRGYSTYRQTNDVGSQTKKTLVMTLDPIDVSYPGTDDSGESV